MYRRIMIALALLLTMTSAVVAQPTIPENAWRDIYDNISTPTQTITNICRALWCSGGENYCGESSSYSVGSRNPNEFCNRLYDSAVLKINHFSWGMEDAKRQLQRYRWVLNRLRWKAYVQCLSSGGSNC